MKRPSRVSLPYGSTNSQSSSSPSPKATDAYIHAIDDAASNSCRSKPASGASTRSSSPHSWDMSTASSSAAGLRSAAIAGTANGPAGPDPSTPSMHSTAMRVTASTVGADSASTKPSDS